MGDFLSLFGVMAAFFALLGLCWLAAWKLGLLNKAGRAGNVDAADDAQSAPEYRSRECVMSPGERTFFPILKEAARLLADARRASLPLVLASVRLAEVLEPRAKRSEKGSGWQGAFNRISAKQVDFLLCDAETTRPIMVIELDDRSHDQRDRKDRDDMVNAACDSAGLPLLRVKTAAGYDSKALAKEMERMLADKGR